MASRSKRAAKPPKKRIIPLVLVGLFVSIISIGSLMVAKGLDIIDSWLVDLPDVAEMASYNTEQTTYIYASDRKTLLATLYLKDRVPVQAHQISPLVFEATVGIEDERYWEHIGVDLYGIARALVADVLGGTQGASTITQQLVRNTILSEEANDQTIERKVREAMLAMEVEQVYSKNEILVMYLNTINYGDGCYGIQSAAQHYFSKNASELTLTEAALLAGIPQSPTYNNPVPYPDNALARRNQVLYRMQVNGYITQEECDAAQASELGLNVKPKSADGILAAPYFVSYVRNILEEMYGTSTVFSNGLVVYTTIDMEMQAYAEQACAEKEETLDSDVEVSLATLEPDTGYIRALRGGKDFYVDQWSTATDMHRDAGSTFKAFALVACLEMGIPPSAEVLGSSPFSLGNWDVENYGGASYGKLTLASATHLSSNTAYARIVRTIGPAAIANVAHRMGVKSDLLVVPSLVLGTSGVNTLEMASAFATLATGGIYHEPTAITEVLDSNGNILYEHVVTSTRVLSSEIAFAATNVLRGVVNQSSGTGTLAYLPSQDCAGKTGTSDDWCDSWFVGFTPQLSTAVWIGAREKRYIADNIGGSNCCPVWKRFMTMALEKYPAAAFPVSKEPTYNSNATFLSVEEQEAEAQRTASTGGGGPG